MVPASSLAPSFNALLRALTVLLVSVATPLSLAVPPDDSRVARKLDHVRHTRAGGPQRLDLGDSAGHHEVGAGPDVVDVTSTSDGVSLSPPRSGPPGQVAIVVKATSLEGVPGHYVPRFYASVSLVSLGGHRPPPGRAPPSV